MTVIVRAYLHHLDLELYIVKSDFALNHESDKYSKCFGVITK